MLDIFTPEQIIILAVCVSVALLLLCAAIRNFSLWKKTPIQIVEIIGYRHMGKFKRPCPIIKFTENTDTIETEIKNIICEAPEGTHISIRRKGNQYIKLNISVYLTAIFFCCAIFNGLFFLQIDNKAHPEAADVFFWCTQLSLIATMICISLAFFLTPLIVKIRFNPHRRAIEILKFTKAPSHYNKKAKQSVLNKNKGDHLSYDELCIYNHHHSNHPLTMLIIIAALVYLAYNLIKLFG